LAHRALRDIVEAGMTGRDSPRISSMAYVVTRLCIDCVDMGCVEVCPVECIYERAEGHTAGRPNMLYIHPTECINCGACEPECPWQAIYEDQELPPKFQADVALNALCEQQPDTFVVAALKRDEHNRIVRKPVPTAADITKNKRQHGL